MRVLILLVLLAQVATFAYYVRVPPRTIVVMVEDAGCSGWIEASTIAATYKYENL